MVQKIKLTVAQLLAQPDARAFFVLGILLIAALAGGAPSDFGGVGGS